MVSQTMDRVRRDRGAAGVSSAPSATYSSPQQQHGPPHKHPHTLSFTSINIQHLSNATKHLEINQFLHTHNPSFLSITETWKSQCTIKHRDYIAYNLSPTHLPSNSACSANQSVLVNRAVPHNPLDSDYNVITNYLSMHWFRIRTSATQSHKYTLVCSVYRSPNPPPELDTWSLMATNISRVMSAYTGHGILLLGDFNARLRDCGDQGGSSRSHPIYSSVLHPHGLHLVNSVLAYGLHTHTYTATSHSAGQSGHRQGTSITDLALANSQTLSLCESMTVLDQSLFSSDHRAIMVVLTGPIQLGVPLTTVPHLRYLKDKLDVSAFSSSMDSTAAVLHEEFSHLLQQGTQQSLDQALSIIHTCYSTAAATSCPRTMVKPGQKPWWNRIPDRTRLRSAYLASRHKKCQYPHSLPAYNRYLQARAEWNHAITVAKDAVFKQFVGQLDANPSLPPTTLLGIEQVSQISLRRRLWWSFYKRTKPSEFGAAMVMGPTGDLPVDQLESLNNLATAFAKISQVKPDTNDFHRHITAEMESIQQESQRDTHTPLPFDMTQLNFIFDRIPNSAAGGDDIHVEFMHATPPSVRSMVFQLYNGIWETGMLPAGFTQAKVVPLYKGDGSRAQVNNYRPISITSLLIRTLERLLRPMYNKLILPRITMYQSGFRPGFSTMDNIHRAVEYIYRVIRNRQYSAMLSIDLSKAFDTVWSEGLLHTLWHRFNVRGRAWKFIKAFLSNRTMYVVGQNVQSILMHLSAGVPQGSVLAPLLFLAYIDILANKVSPDATLSLYADDALAWPRVMGREGLIRILAAAATIYHWSVDYKLTLNQSKSTLLRITNKRSMLASHMWPQLKVGSYYTEGEASSDVMWTLPYTDSLNILGITVQGNGRWTTQAQQLTARISSLAHTISRLCTRDGPPEPISIYTVTRAVILSTIMYGFCMWRPTQTTMHRLQSLLCLPIKQVLVQSSRSVSTLGILAEYGIPPLHILRQGQLLSFYHKQLSIDIQYKHLSRNCAIHQRHTYLYHTSSKHTAAYAQSMYSEAEHIAANILPVNTAFPTTWTPSVVTQAVAQASTCYLRLYVTGQKALTQCNPYSNGLFQPQFYLFHEIKPASCARARLRLDIALTPAVLHRYNPALSPHCPHCAHAYADRTHLLLHCPRYTAVRHALARTLWKHTAATLTLPMILDSMHTIFTAASQHGTNKTKDYRLAILTTSSTLIQSITDDLPNTYKPYGNDVK